MPDCTGQQMLFGRVGRCEIEADFSGGALSSDGGLMLVRQVDRQIGLSRAIAAALFDPRDPDRVKHSLRDLIADAAASLVGEDKVDRNKPPSMGSEDFSFMMEKVTGAYIQVGNGDSAQLHNPAYDFNDACTPYGAAVLATVAVQNL